MTEKPLLCAMNNPLSSDRRLALYPHPPNCTGWRLWQMLAEAGEREGLEISSRDYLQAFERTNVLHATTWSRAEARAGGEAVRALMRGRATVVLGVQTADALRLPRSPWGEWQAHAGERTWCLLPHPSGRCREYNDPEMRALAGRTLLRLYRGEAPSSVRVVAEADAPRLL